MPAGPRRELLAVLGLCLLGAVLTLAASAPAWVRVAVPRTRPLADVAVSVAGRSLVPLVPDVGQVARVDGSLVVVLAAERGDAVDAVVAEVNRRLVDAAVPVYSIEPERVSLEERFLQMTSRLEDET